MKKSLVLLLAVLFATSASAVVHFQDLGTGAPPATLGGFTVSSIDSIPSDGTTISTLTDTVATLKFSLPVRAATVPGTWTAWSHSATPRVLISFDNSLSFTLAPNAAVFYLYIEPADPYSHSITVKAYNGPSILASGTENVTGNGGASGFGFYADAGEQITKIGITAQPGSSGFAIGELAMTPLRSITVDTSPAGLGITVDGTSYTAPQSFAWVGGSNHTIATTSPQTATGTRFLFQSWSDAGAMSHSVTTPSSTTTYTVSFLTQYYLTTAASPSGAGSISPPSGYFDGGTSVSVSAAAGNGDVFVGFSGDLSGTTTPQSLLMNGPESVTADFALAAPTLDWLGVAALAALLAVLGLLAVRRAGA